MLACLPSTTLCWRSDKRRRRQQQRRRQQWQQPRPEPRQKLPSGAVKHHLVMVLQVVMGIDDVDLDTAAAGSRTQTCGGAASSTKHRRVASSIGHSATGCGSARQSPVLGPIIGVAIHHCDSYSRAPMKHGDCGYVASQSCRCIPRGRSNSVVRRSEFHMVSNVSVSALAHTNTGGATRGERFGCSSRQ